MASQGRPLKIPRKNSPHARLALGDNNCVAKHNAISRKCLIFSAPTTIRLLCWRWSFQVADHPDLEGKYGCIVELELVGEQTWRMYTLIAVLAQYCIPLSIITFCHIHMAKVKTLEKLDSSPLWGGRKCRFHSKEKFFNIQPSKLPWFC